jgi:hypothetical protein
VFQTRLRLEAVFVEETSDTLQLPADVDYEPDNGWEYEPINSFPNVGVDDRMMAFYSGWRWFRVIGQADGTWQVPDASFEVTELSQILPFHEKCVSSATNDDGSYPFAYDPFMRGNYWPQGDTAEPVTDKFWEGKFHFNRNRGLVVTEYPVINFDSAGKVVTPQLYVSAAYNVRDKQTGEMERPKQWQSVGGAYGTKVLVRPECFGAVAQLYWENNAPAMTIDTRTDATAELRAYLALFQQRYAGAGLVCEVVEFPGYGPCQLDGKIAQITLEYGYSDTPLMRISTGYEHDVYNQSFEESLRKFTLQRLAEESAA